MWMKSASHQRRYNVYTCITKWTPKGDCTITPLPSLSVSLPLPSLSLSLSLCLSPPLIQSLRLGHWCFQLLSKVKSQSAIMLVKPFSIYKNVYRKKFSLGKIYCFILCRYKTERQRYVELNNKRSERYVSGLAMCHNIYVCVCYYTRRTCSSVA